MLGTTKQSKAAPYSGRLNGPTGISLVLLLQLLLLLMMLLLKGTWMRSAQQHAAARKRRNPILWIWSRQNF
jgi:hypothetical protein